MRHALEVFLAGSSILLFSSCVTTVPRGEPTIGVISIKNTSNEDLREVETRMKAFFDNGVTKIDQGNISEGIQQLVAVLAEKDKLQNPSSAAEDTASKAAAELTRIGSALSMDSGTEWLDENKNQMAASILDVGTPKGLQPSVIVAYNMGRGRTLVAGAPILFEFIKGSGVLTSYATTNEYGQANCTVAKVDAQNQEQIIHASLVFKVNAFTYRFQGIEKDFAFVPPVRRATILVLEKTPQGSNQPPIILDSVYNTLKGVTFDFSQYDGTLLGNDFEKVFSGDPQAIKALGMKKDVSYLVMVLNDCYNSNQVVLDGKAYNLYKSQTNATTRIIRVADGKILYSGAVQGVSGQGGASDKAVVDGLRNAAVNMASKLKTDLQEINKALAPK